MSEQEPTERNFIAQIKDIAADSIDAVVGLGTSDKIAAGADVIMGRAQQAVGAALNNEELEQAGAEREFEGKADWVGGEVRQRGQQLGRGVRWFFERSADTLEAILYPYGRPGS